MAESAAFVPADQDSHELASEFAALAREMCLPGGQTVTLQAVCELAVKVLHVDEAAITVRRGSAFTTLAETGPTASAIDAIQYSLDEGPCVGSIEDHATYVSNDLLTDRRWPRFGVEAFRETGVRSMMAQLLYVGTDTIGALNTYSRKPDAFDTEKDVLGSIFAAHAALALHAAESRDRTAHLERALMSSRRIGMAIGILMSTEHLTPEAAVERLKRYSQDHNRKVAEIADLVIYTGALD